MSLPVLSRGLNYCLIATGAVLLPDFSGWADRSKVLTFMSSKMVLASLPTLCYRGDMAKKTMFIYVLDELQACKGTWVEVADETGLDYSWLTKLAQGRIPDPSVNKIQRLADYFILCSISRHETLPRFS